MFCRANRGKELSSEKIFADLFFFGHSSCSVDTKEI